MVRVPSEIAPTRDAHNTARIQSSQLCAALTDHTVQGEVSQSDVRSRRLMVGRLWRGTTQIISDPSPNCSPQRLLLRVDAGYHVAIASKISRVFIIGND